MKVTIWGARGSIPTPIRPEQIRRKIISALLNISAIDNIEFKQEVLAAIMGDSSGSGSLNDSGQPDPLIIKGSFQKQLRERQQVIEAYLDNLSPLAAKTASGNTPCVEVQSGRDIFIIDAGSGIRELGEKLMQGECGQGKGIVHLFFSHPHWDHIQGFPFFRPAYVPGNKIFVYGVHNMEFALRRQQEFVSFPIPLDGVQADLQFVQLEPEGLLQFGDLFIRVKRNHHPGNSYSFRFEKGNKIFVYASDSSYPSDLDLQPYITFFAEADVLIFDAHFTQRESDEKEDWGHSSSFMGVEIAQKANVKSLVLFHHDPNCSDADLERILEDTKKFQKNQYPTREPVKIILAEEGLTFNLLPTPTTQLHQVPGGKIAILKPAGIFDEYVAAELSRQLAELRQNNWPPQLIVDMAAVEMLQVSGLRALVKIRKEQQSTPMVLAGPSINVQQLIELAGYLDFFAIYPSVHAALNALKAHETLNLPGQIIKNRYRIEAKVGDGRLGTVFKAFDTRHNIPIALKILSASFSEGAIEQFLNQGRQIIDLAHPNIVDIYDCDEDRGLSFMAEEFIEGDTLRDLLDEQEGQLLSLVDALSIAEGIAAGLEYAHGHGVIHGDLKPKNVMLAGDLIKISDFGLGRLESGKSLLNIDIPLAMVTAQYVAPEQVLGHPIDARTDLYALGAILYELFTGQAVFTGSDEEVLKHHQNTLPIPLRQINSQISYALEHLILKLLDKDPNKRYAKASQVRRILASMVTFAQGRFSRQRWPQWIEDTNSAARQQLIELWRKTEQGQGQLVFITGEAGVGKTRLVQEFTQRIGEVVLLLGKCHELEGSPAYRPFAKALTTYFFNTPAAVDRQPLQLVLEQMARFIPEVRQVTLTNLKIEPEPAPGSTGEPRHPTDEYSLNLPSNEAPEEFVSLAALLRETTQDKPILLVLDDLHWADPNSLQLLSYLSRHQAQMRLMIVGIFQASQVADNEPLVDLLSNLEKNLGYTTITVDPLSKEGVAQLLTGFWLQEAPPDLAKAIYRRTRGNPLYIEEVAKGLVDDGVVSRRDNKWHFAPVVEVGLPKSAQDAVLRRLNRLSKETQTLLHQAAILGQTFSFDDLHEMSDLSMWDALESLDIALERQLLKEIPGEGVLRFKHIEIQRVLYHNLSPLKRQLMHREAGEALERRLSTEAEVGDKAEALAYHFYQAKEFEKALHYSRRAAAEAQAVWASPTALFWYTQALDALEQLNQEETTRPAQFELLLAREQLYNRQGQREAQAITLADLQRLAQQLDDPAKQATVHNRRAAYERLVGHFAEAETEAQAGLIAARQANQPDLEQESLLQLAHLAVPQANFAAAHQYIEAVQKIAADAPQSQALHVVIYQLLGDIYRQQYDYAQAETQYRQALRLSRTLGHWLLQAESANRLGGVYLIAGKYLEAENLCYTALEIQRFIGYRLGEATSLHHLALIFSELGYYHPAQQMLERALQLRRAGKDQIGEAEDLKVLGAIRQAGEDYDLAQRHLEQALAIFQQFQQRQHEAETWLEIGLLAESVDNWSKARTAYQMAYEIQQSLGNQAGQIEAKGGLARCFLNDDQFEAAKQEAEMCAAWLESHGSPGINHSIRLYLTVYRVSRALRETERAEKALLTVQTLLQQRAGNIEDLKVRTSLFSVKLDDQGVLRKALP